MRPALAYRLAKLHFLPQQLRARVLFGIMLILGSHMFERADERGWLRDLGMGVVTMSAAGWLSAQGKRRMDEQGRPLRSATMRFLPPEEDRG